MPQLPRRTGPPSHRTRQAARSAAHTSGAVGSGCPVPCVVCVCVCVCVSCVCVVCVSCVCRVVLFIPHARPQERALTQGRQTTQVGRQSEKGGGERSESHQAGAKILRPWVLLNHSNLRVKSNSTGRWVSDRQADRRVRKHG